MLGSDLGCGEANQLEIGREGERERERWYVLFKLSTDRGQERMKERERVVASVFPVGT